MDAVVVPAVSPASDTDGGRGGAPPAPAPSVQLPPLPPPPRPLPRDSLSRLASIRLPAGALGGSAHLARTPAGSHGPGPGAPQSLLSWIAVFLRGTDVARLSMTCNDVGRALRSTDLWRHLSSVDFGGGIDHAWTEQVLAPSNAAADSPERWRRHYGKLAGAVSPAVVSGLVHAVERLTAAARLSAPASVGDMFDFGEGGDTDPGEGGDTDPARRRLAIGAARAAIDDVRRALDTCEHVIGVGETVRHTDFVPRTLRGVRSPENLARLLYHSAVFVNAGADTGHNAVTRRHAVHVWLRQHSRDPGHTPLSETVLDSKVDKALVRKVATPLVPPGEALSPPAHIFLRLRVDLATDDAGARATMEALVPHGVEVAAPAHDTRRAGADGGGGDSDGVDEGGPSSGSAGASDGAAAAAAGHAAAAATTPDHSDDRDGTWLVDRVLEYDTRHMIIASGPWDRHHDGRRVQSVLAGGDAVSRTTLRAHHDGTAAPTVRRGARAARRGSVTTPRGPPHNPSYDKAIAANRWVPLAVLPWPGASPAVLVGGRSTLRVSCHNCGTVMRWLGLDVRTARRDPALGDQVGAAGAGCVASGASSAHDSAAAASAAPAAALDTSGFDDAFTAEDASASGVSAPDVLSLALACSWHPIEFIQALLMLTLGGQGPHADVDLEVGMSRCGANAWEEWRTPAPVFSLDTR